MREFNCIVCGTKAIDRSHSQSKVFCSLDCKNQHWRMTHALREDNWQRCVFNDGVACDLHRCGRCGWNPTVAKRRLEAAYG